nr:glycerophosphodiester phosphodiesterase [Candidatus Sigynarchaeum springense]MDO8119291.1 glycerophosphodiester phosphodiesterase [Candidatus Sigynarchaeota archaeon]
MAVKRKVRLSGHRGYKDGEIENTWKAFQRAIAEKIDYVEFDVKKTSDGVLVVYHDEFLTRLLHVNKRIGKVSWKELQGYAYDDGQHVLALDDFFTAFKGKIKPMLEIKAGGIEKQLLALVEKHGLETSIIIQCFNGRHIKKCHSLRPNITYGLCIGPASGAISYHFLVKPYPVTYLNIDGPLVDDRFVHACIQGGKKIILGARNTWEYLDKIEPWNVEIINADNPARIKQLLIERHYEL